MARRDLIEAVAYLRTSSSTNVGGDSDRRQREAIQGFAERAGFRIIDEFYDPAVSGDDDLGDRPGFSAMLDQIEERGIRVVILEDATRFARKVLVQELGILTLASRNVAVWSARGEINLTETDDEFKIAMRQIAAVFAELEKRRLVKKLKAARDRKKAEIGKCGGRRSYAERDPAMVELARKLYRYPVGGRQRSLRDVSAELAHRGYLAASGKAFGVGAIARMLEQ